MLPVAELHGVRPHELTPRILESTQPLVLRGLVADWPVVQAARTSQQAADAYLRRFYGGMNVVAMLGRPEIDGRFFYNDDLSGFNFFPANVRLDGVLAELEDHRNDERPPAIYVGSTTIDTCLPGFRSENDVDLQGREALASIWIGNRTRIAAHYDLPDNLACVAAGRRRFTLFPPEQLANLYIGPLDFTPAGQAISLVDFRQPDFERFPKFAEALPHGQVAELEPGDALFIPSMWWHHVEALDRFNVLVNYWWRQSPGYMDTPTTALMHAIMTVRDLPPAQRAAWRQLFDHYVFDADERTAAHIPPAARRVLGPLDADATRALRAQLLKRMNR
ncbi:cupin-like domain-containing protein [Pseudoduganella chitinolytica]|uniref:Cupin-like domain-containing protein n=1 Tax=Pseudoduganella chitinolytica TaxID=34070 RepID=A0ABY8BAI9_9BURK|nr:cupin-like domain-containing protein [Pseudoduganella chitinolytica]WEF32023.1 cupin-like domain-containing protein [Pseudoduganella chitinolytica]